MARSAATPADCRHRDYLDWLDATLRDAAERGLADRAMLLPIPGRFCSTGAGAPNGGAALFFMVAMSAQGPG